MARNRGKRPGDASGSSSVNRSEPGNPAQPVTEPAQSDQAKPGAAKAETGTPAAAKVEPAKVTSSQTDPATKPAVAAASGNAPSTKPASGSVPAAAKVESKAGGAAPTPPPPANGGGGFLPGLFGGLLGGAAIALAASFYLLNGQKPVSTAELQELSQRLDATENRIADWPEPTDQVAANEALAVRLAGLEEEVSTLDGGAEANGSLDVFQAETSESLDLFKQEIARLEQAIAQTSQAQQSSADVVEGLEGALSTLESGLAAADGKAENAGQQATALDGAVQTLSARIEQAEAKLDFQGGEYQRGAAMVVAIGDIDRAISLAEPFETQLASLRALGMDSPEVADALAALEPLAKEGGPTLDDLETSFVSVSSRILLTDSDDGSLVDQVTDNLFGIINMRPAGAVVEGDNNRAVVARARAKLSDGDLEGVVSELAALEPAAMEKAAPWIADVESRLAADAKIISLRDYAQRLLMTGS